MPIRLVFYKLTLLSALIALFIPALGQKTQERPFDLYVGEDSINIYSISEIIERNLINNKLPNSVVNKGNVNFPVYVKIIVRNNQSSDQKYLVIPNPILDQVTYYQSALDSHLLKETTPLEARIIEDQNFIFPLQKDTFYIKVESKEQMLFNVVIATQNEIFETNNIRDKIVFFYLFIIPVTCKVNQGLIMFLFKSLFNYVFQIVTQKTNCYFRIFAQGKLLEHPVKLGEYITSCI